MTTISPVYTERPPTSADAEAVAALIAACERDLDGRSHTIAESVRHDWIGLDLHEEAIAIVRASGEMVAYGDLNNRAYRGLNVFGFVHPDHRGRGLGARLVDWGERWIADRLHLAPPHARVVVQHFVRDENQPAKRLLSSRGYEPVRTVYVMEMELVEPLPEPEWPEGLRVRAYRRGQDDMPVHLAREAAMADMWERPPDTLENWVKFASEHDPELNFVVEDIATGAIAGTCIGTLAGDEGDVGGLCVTSVYRKRGIATAMLRHAYRELYARGARRGTLCVDADSPTGAPRVYLRAGLRNCEAHIVYRKEIRPGVGLGEVITDP